MYIRGQRSCEAAKSGCTAEVYKYKYKAYIYIYSI